MRFASGKWLFICAACFSIGSVSSFIFSDEPQIQKEPFTQDQRLGSSLYMQTSGEYRACCLQIYKCAEMRLEALMQGSHPHPFKPAVVMDLDETVLDNSAFYAFLHKTSLEYTQALWDNYEEKYFQEVGVVPGAREFIAKAESLGVNIIYISNRSQPYIDQSTFALERNGINVANIRERLFLKRKDEPSDKSDKSDKTARRDAVAAKFNVLMYFGDNLRDFSETFAAKKMPANAAPADFAAEIAARKLLIDQSANHWGIDWFVLPNPEYGPWDKLVGPHPKMVLHPTTMVAP